jgi:ATP-dependent RNA helicase RhlE
MKFHDLGLHPQVLRAVTREGYTEATPIQTAAIPLILAGRDVLGSAQTGTGKTAAFALPAIHHLLPEKTPNHHRLRRHRRRPIRVLVLAPTRELACQVEKSFRTYGRCTDLRSALIYGGVSQKPQVEALSSGADIVIATPGRLLDLIAQGHIQLGAVEMLVLDEADQMLDMGFIHDLKRIVNYLPRDRQTLMFSATMPGEIRRLANQWLEHPKTVQASPEASPPSQIEQSVTFVAKHRKPAKLVQVLQQLDGHRQLVFCRTKRDVDRLVRSLRQAKIPALALHGNKSQNARHEAIKTFSSSHPPVLVATDVAARGLHIPSVSHVINYNLPEVPETYVHRIGRTARAGAEGISISFCSEDERPHLRRIEKLIRRALDVQELAAGQDSDSVTNRQGNSSSSPKHGALGQPNGAKRRQRTSRRPRKGKQQKV